MVFALRPAKPAVLSGHCSHLGADLSLGSVRGENLHCPLHGWEYRTDGSCKRIPAATTIPPFARQISYPVQEMAGHVFFSNRPEPRFPLPFFEGVNPADVLAAPAFEFMSNSPWDMLGTNGFDVQHFRCAHDRALLSEPIVESPHPLARQLRAEFEVVGDSFYDRLTRAFSGSRVAMTVTSWCGNLILVSARFRRSTSYGIVSLIPVNEHSTRLR